MSVVGRRVKSLAANATRTVVSGSVAYAFYRGLRSPRTSARDGWRPRGHGSRVGRRCRVADRFARRRLGHGIADDAGPCCEMLRRPDVGAALCSPEEKSGTRNTSVRSHGPPLGRQQLLLFRRACRPLLITVIDPCGPAGGRRTDNLFVYFFFFIVTAAPQRRSETHRRRIS